MRAPGSKDGFTLIELVSVIAVAAVLAGIAGLQMRRVTNRTRYNRAQAEIETIVLALSSMRVDTGTYPASLPCYQDDPGFFNNDKSGIGLAALRLSLPPSYLGVASRYWGGPYLGNRMNWEENGAGFLDLIDPWGNPYFFFVFPDSLSYPYCVITPEFGSGAADYYRFYYNLAEATDARIRIINHGDASGSGVMHAASYYLIDPLNPNTNPRGRPHPSSEITSNSDFRNQIPLINKPIHLIKGENLIMVKPVSKPLSWNIFTITSEFPEYSDAPVRDVYVVGSFGANGQMNGTGFDAPIIHGIMR